MAAYLSETSYITLNGSFDWSNAWSVEMEVWIDEDASEYSRLFFDTQTDRIQFRNTSRDLWFEMGDDRNTIPVDAAGHWRKYRFTYSGGLSGTRTVYYDDVLVLQDTISVPSLPSGDVKIGDTASSLQGYVRNVVITNNGANYYTASLDSSVTPESGSSSATNNGATFGPGPTHTPTTIYVDRGAAITDESGTASNPCLTIASAILLARKGDEIFIRGNVYRESLDLTNKTDITVNGERGPNNEWLVILDGTISLSWEPAPEYHANAWKTQVDMYDGFATGKYLYNGEKLVPKIQDGYSTMDILSSDWDFEATDRVPEYGTNAVRVWDVIYAVSQGIDVEGTPWTFYRSRDHIPEGDRTEEIPGVENVRMADKQYGIDLGSNRSFNNTVKNLKVFGFYESACRIGPKASSNEVFDCRLMPSDYAVLIDVGATKNEVHNNDCRQSALQWRGGDWGYGYTYNESKNEWLYKFWKFVAHVGDSTQSGVRFYFPGDDNVVRANLIGGTVKGVMFVADEAGLGSRGLRNRLESNEISDCSSLGVYFTQSSHAYVSGNLISNANSMIRFGSMHLEQDTDIWITGNTLKSRLDNTQSLYFHLEGSGTHGNPWSIELSGNTFIRGEAFRPNGQVENYANVFDNMNVDGNQFMVYSLFDGQEEEWDTHPLGSFTNNTIDTDQDLTAWVAKPWWGSGNTIVAPAD